MYLYSFKKGILNKPRNLSIHYTSCRIMVNPLLSIVKKTNFLSCYDHKFSYFLLYFCQMKNKIHVKRIFFCLKHVLFIVLEKMFTIKT